MTRSANLATRLRLDTVAIAATEFALAAPLLLTTGLWGFETANLAITHMRVSQAATHIADNASRIGDTSALIQRKTYEEDIEDLFLGSNIQAGDALNLYDHGRVILSSLETEPGSDSGQNYIHWQRCKGHRRVASSYGLEGDGRGDPGFAGMGPAGQEVFAMEGEAVMFVEIVYEYQPIVTDAFIRDRIIRATSAFNVRHDRDLSQIYTRKPDREPSKAECSRFDGYGDAREARREEGGWDWNW